MEKIHEINLPGNQRTFILNYSVNYIFFFLTFPFIADLNLAIDPKYIKK